MGYLKEKKVKVLYLLLICIFGLLLVLPLVLSNKVRKPIVSEAENRYLAGFPQLKDSITHQFNSQFYPEFESWLNDHIGFRENMVQLNSAIDFSIFHVSPSKKVYIGRNNWLFFTEEHNLSIASGNFPLTEKDYAEIAAFQAQVSHYLAQQGIDYFFLLAPSKVSIYPEKASVFYSPRETPIDFMVDALKKEGVHYINPKPLFLEARDSLQLYHKADTHWNHHGIILAHQLVLDSLRKYNHLTTDVEYKAVEVEFIEDLATMIRLKKQETVYANVPVVSRTLWDEATELKTLTDSICKHSLAYNREECYITESIDPNSKGIVLLIGDSFGVPFSFVVKEHCKRFIFVRTDLLSKEIIEWAQPDVVIYERTERGFTTINRHF